MTSYSFAIALLCVFSIIGMIGWYKQKRLGDMRKLPGLPADVVAFFDREASEYNMMIGLSIAVSAIMLAYSAYSIVFGR